MKNGFPRVEMNGLRITPRNSENFLDQVLGIFPRGMRSISGTLALAPMLRRSGGSRFQREDFKLSTNRQSSIKNAGFSFFEIMVTVAVLSFGIVIIFQAFIISLNTFDYYLTHLQAQNLADEKIWEISDELMQKDSLDISETNGNFIIGSKKVTWNIDVVPMDEKGEFFNLNLIVSWQEGDRKIEVQRATYTGI
jgi:hypothetical protein